MGNKHPAKPEWRTINDRRGQSLVELAISLTVILILLSGAFTFGMALFSYVALRDAAEEGALYASIDTLNTPSTVDTAGIRAHVRQSSTSPVNMADTGLIPDSFISISPTNGSGTVCEGSNISGVPNGITVTVEYDYPIIMPYIGGIIGSQKIHLKATATDTILQPHCP